MSERNTHQAWGAGYIVSPDPNTYRPARFSRWRLLLAAMGLKKLPALYVVCGFQAAIERTRERMAANALGQTYWPPSDWP